MIHFGRELQSMSEHLRRECGKNSANKKMLKVTQSQLSLLCWVWLSMMTGSEIKSWSPNILAARGQKKESTSWQIRDKIKCVVWGCWKAFGETWSAPRTSTSLSALLISCLNYGLNFSHWTRTDVSHGNGTSVLFLKPSPDQRFISRGNHFRGLQAKVWDYLAECLIRCMIHSRSC